MLHFVTDVRADRWCAARDSGIPTNHSRPLSLVKTFAASRVAVTPSKILHDLFVYSKIAYNSNDKWPSSLLARRNMFSKLDSLCRFSQRCRRMRHYWGRAPNGLWPNIRTRPIFLYNAPTPKFHRPTLTRSEVIVLTNTPTVTPNRPPTHTHRRRWKHPTLFATLRRLVKNNLLVDFN